MNKHGWLWTAGHIVGNLDEWATSYNWDGKTYRTRAEAAKAGLREYGSDDFNIAHLTNGTVDWWGWMDEPHPIGDARKFADQYGVLVDD